MSPATVELLLKSLPVLLQVVTQAAGAASKLMAKIQQAEAEGRALTADELAEFAAVSDAAVAEWTALRNAVVPPADPALP
ncbi:MAG TPA: hypothetical protein VJ890_21275 [Vineibacter sp.]|nr:hypothetical protein [Vineibacter sp.]